MSFTDNEAFLTVPAEIVKFNKGFGVDIGSSGAKFVYFTKEDKEKADLSNAISHDFTSSFRQKTKAVFRWVPISGHKLGKFTGGRTATAQIRTITLQRSELMEGLKFIRQRAFLFTDRTDEQSSEEVIFTGIGCTQLEKTIAGLLNVKFKVIHEMDCAVAAFDYMAEKLSRRHLLEPRNEQAVTYAINFMVNMAQALASVKKGGHTVTTTTDFDPQQLYTVLQQTTGHTAGTGADDDAASDVTLLQAEPRLYPYLMVFCGSFIFSLKCTAPNDFSYGDMIPTGGRTLLGIANKLIGCKTYKDLMDLASKGDSSKVNESSAEAFRSEDAAGEDNLYKSFTGGAEFMNSALYYFGKLVGADCAKFKDEDIASALVEVFIQDFVRSVHLFSLVQGIKRVFLCGGILSHPYVRRLVVVEMVKKNLNNFMIAQVNGKNLGRKIFTSTGGTVKTSKISRAQALGFVATTADKDFF